MDDDRDMARTDGAGDKSDDRDFVTALARGLELLRCFRPGERYIGLTELSRRTGIPKPSVARLAGTLTRLGYLNFSPAARKYQLGAGVLSLGYAMISNIDVRQVARSMMQQLAEYSQASVSIGVRDRLEMVYVESIRSTASIDLPLGIGSRLALGTSSLGRAYLAVLPQTERDQLMDELRASDEQGWPQVKAGIEQALRDYADHGFCISMGDWNKAIHGVAVPYVAPDGTIMAFNCGGAAFLLSRDKLEHDIGPRLIGLVKTVEAATGRG